MKLKVNRRRLDGAQSLIVGIRPTAKGGIAWLDMRDGNIRQLETMTSVPRFWQLLERTRPSIGKVVVEQGKVRLGIDSREAYDQGMLYGGILGVLDALQLRYQITAKMVWQQQIHGEALHAGKTRSIIAARQRWPDETFVPPGAQKIHLGMLDAALIADFGRRK